MSTVLSNDEVAANIKANALRLLEDSGWSQRELARRTGDAHMSIVNVLNGAHVPSSALLARLAEAFGVTTDEMLSTPKATKKNRQKSA